MEPIPFEFTPEQKGLLESLSCETGKPVAALIAEALEALQEHVRHTHGNGSDEEQPALPLNTQKPVWELLEEASCKIPDEELDRLPTDLAAQVDHYLYGTPKR
jgi:hypothetical protein